MCAAIRLKHDRVGTDARLRRVLGRCSRDLVMPNRTFVQQRFRPRRAQMFSLTRLPPRHLQLQLRHLGLRIGVLSADRGVVGPQLGEFFQ